ncbi:fibrobacter succinogenes major paralogous domain-containing protein [Chryseobacterium fistulae]|uniref:Uncharacterized protein n=1 Tax=Chryseobacterium fistulae TaxID=2675058 RepID=A0A6N4XP81_9FLAO|nr:FISUMP domain-containing protein [Chryseobacterium fistulae]CAA7388619.1 hypothetical protein CHRY9393_01988 [Chryseobacterium fistulae]
MRKTNLLVCMLLGVVSFGQIGINNPSPKATLEITAKKLDGSTPEGVIVPKFTGDILFAAMTAGTYGPNQHGAIVYVSEPALIANRTGQTAHVDDYGFYYFNADQNEWTKLGSVSTIYRTDGTLTSPRIMTMAGNNLGFLGGRIGMGTASPDTSAILDLTSTQTGFAPPRMLESQMNAIANPTHGLLIFCTDCFNDLGCLMVNDSKDPTVPNWGSLCSSNVPTGHVNDILCASAVTSGAVHSGVIVSGVSVTVPYTAGNGGTYPSATFSSTGVTGLTASLDGGSLVNGDGNLIFTITGTPSVAGTASFNITVAGKSCAFTVDVDDFTASVVSIDCVNAVFSPSTVTQGQPYTGTLTIPYLGGNGDSYPQQSFTQNGLTFTLPAGTLATGNGSFVYNVTGSATSSGAMSIPISFGSNSCNVSTTISNGGGGGSVVMCGASTAWALFNLGADTSLDPNPVTVAQKGLHGNYYQQGIQIPVADADTPATSIFPWNTSFAPIGAWNSGTETAPVKTGIDPCPAGFRVPTRQEYLNLHNNNSPTRIGTFLDGATNYTSALVYTCGNKRITFPATGYRNTSDGVLLSRGSQGWYWTSSDNTPGMSLAFGFYPSTIYANYANIRSQGFPVRCVAE